MAEKIIDGKMLIVDIFTNIREHKYDNLDEFLKEADWFSVDTSVMLPRAKVRTYLRSIKDKEVCLAVINFLDRYASDLFYENEKTRLIIDTFGVPNPSNPNSTVISEIVLEAQNNIDNFRKELLFQKELIVSSGEFSGDKFSKLQNKVAALEKQVKTLKDENKKISDELYFIKHPEEFGKHIPIELNDPIFKDAMSYLISQNLATSHLEKVSYGLALNSYYWYGAKSLFGYFVDRISHELELRDSGGRLNWKPFKHAFINFDEIIDEARNAVSKYTQNKRARKPEQADTVEKAIKYAYQIKEKEEARSKKNAESRELKVGRPILNG